MGNILMKENATDNVANLRRSCVGLYFNEKRISYVLLKQNATEQYILQSYATIALGKGIVVGGKIIDMEFLIHTINRITKLFSATTTDVVVSIPQSLVTVDYFRYDGLNNETLEDAAEYEAVQIADLDEINYDYYLFDENTQEDNVVLTVVKKTDVDSRLYLTEKTNLNLIYLDVETVAFVNAYFYWINTQAPDLENEVLAIYNIARNYTQVVFVLNGKILYSSEISIGIMNLINEISEYRELSEQELFDELKNHFDSSLHEELLFDVRNRLAQEIQRSIQIFYSVNDVDRYSVNKILLTGIGAEKFQIKAVLTQLTGIEAQILNPLESVPVSSSVNQAQLKQDACDLTVAFGLALRGFL